MWFEGLRSSFQAFEIDRPGENLVENEEDKTPPVEKAARQRN